MTLIVGAFLMTECTPPAWGSLGGTHHCIFIIIFITIIYVIIVVVVIFIIITLIIIIIIAILSFMVPISLSIHSFRGASHFFPVAPDFFHFIDTTRPLF